MLLLYEFYVKLSLCYLMYCKSIGVFVVLVSPAMEVLPKESACVSSIVRTHNTASVDLL
jgi:hypothetical protein